MNLNNYYPYLDYADFSITQSFLWSLLRIQFDDHEFFK